MSLKELIFNDFRVFAVSFFGTAILSAILSYMWALSKSIGLNFVIHSP